MIFNDKRYIKTFLSGKSNEFRNNIKGKCMLACKNYPNSTNLHNKYKNIKRSKNLKNLLS